jgi:hypothetical protein
MGKYLAQYSQQIKWSITILHQRIWLCKKNLVNEGFDSSPISIVSNPDQVKSKQILAGFRSESGSSKSLNILDVLNKFLFISQSFKMIVSREFAILFLI